MITEKNILQISKTFFALDIELIIVCGMALTSFLSLQIIGWSWACSDCAPSDEDKSWHLQHRYVCFVATLISHVLQGVDMPLFVLAQICLREHSIDFLYFWLQGRAEDFQIGEALTFYRARNAQNFLQRHTLFLTFWCVTKDQVWCQVNLGVALRSLGVELRKFRSL